MQINKNEIELAKKILLMLEDTPIINIIIKDSYATVTFGLESYDEYIDSSYHSVSKFPQKFQDTKIDEVVFNDELNSLIKKSSKEIYYNKSERGEIKLQLKSKVTTNNTDEQELPIELSNYMNSNKRTILCIRKGSTFLESSPTLANIVLSCDKYYVPYETDGKYIITLNKIKNINNEYFELYKLKEHKDKLIFEIINKQK